MRLVTPEVVEGILSKGIDDLCFNHDDAIKKLIFDFSRYPNLKKIRFLNPNISLLDITLGNQLVSFIECENGGSILIKSADNYASKIVINDSKFKDFETLEGDFDCVEIVNSRIDCCKISKLKMHNPKKCLLIDESHLNNLWIENVFSKGEILLRESFILEDFSIKNSEINNLCLYKTTVESDTEVSNSRSSILLIQSKFKAIFECLGTNIPNFYSSFCQFQEHCYLSFEELKFPDQDAIGKLELISNNFVGGIFVGDFDVENEDAENEEAPNRDKAITKVNSVILRFMGAGSSDVAFKNLTINAFSMTGINKSSAIQISECYFDGNVVFTDLINLGQISIGDSRFSKNSRILFYTANMGNFSLFAMNFSDCPIIDFYNSDLSKLNYYGLIWPSQQNISKNELGDSFFNSKENQEEDYHDYLVNRKELYMQLKKVAEGKSDVVNALKFHRFEMLCQDQLLKIDKKQPFEENIILFLGKTNNYGNSWLKPILILLVINFFMSLSATMLFCNCADSSHNGVSPLGYFVNVFFEFLNPLHSKQIFGTGELSPIILILDYMHRLVVSFFAFQIIVAFRKYVRK